MSSDLDKKMTNKTSLSIVIPTLGRASLKKAVDSIIPQLSEDDEIVVVSDGPSERAKQICETFLKRVRYFEHGPTRKWGHAQRNFGMERAAGTHLAFMDDDDVYFPNALGYMRKGILENKNNPIIFKSWICEVLYWKERKIDVSNVSTQMFLVPNIPSRLAKWRPDTSRESGRGGDSVFMRDTVALWPPESLIWREEILASHAQCGWGNP